VLFFKKKGREGDDGGEVGARAVCSKFQREEMENGEKSKKLQNFEILPMTNGHF
jgi:hypothetical protein